MFRSQFQRIRVRSCAGSRERALYQLQADADGVLDLVECGKEDVYEYIQSFKDSTDIHVLLARFRSGESDVLNQRVGQFADVSMMPNNYAEILNACIKGEAMFNSLPKETREKFGNSFAAFMAQMDDPKAFADKVGVDVATALGFVGAAAVPASAGGAAQSGAAGVGATKEDSTPVAASAQEGGAANE